MYNRTIGYAVGFQLRRIDHDLQQFLAIADHDRLQHLGQNFNFPLQVFCDAQQYPFGYSLTADSNLYNRQVNRGGFLDNGFFGGLRESYLGAVNGFPDFTQGILAIEIDVELDHDRRRSLAGE